MIDLSTLIANWGCPTGCSAAKGDLNGDGKIDIFDLSIMLSQWGPTSSSSTVSVANPALVSMTSLLPAFTSTSTLSVSAPSDVTAGGTLTLGVSLNTNGNATTGTDAVIVYDPTRFSFVSASSGGLYNGVSNNGVLTQSSPGRLLVSDYDSVGTSFSGSGTFAQVTFQALSNAPDGRTNISLDFDPNNQQKSTDSNVVAVGGSLDTLGSVSGASVYVHNPSAGGSTCTNAAKFVSDVTIPDGTQMSPGQGFTKTWRIQNTGTCSWRSGYALTSIGGTPMTSVNQVAVPSVAPGGTADLSVTMTAPRSAGTYTSYWQMASPTGVTFGDTVWAEITVVGSVGPTEVVCDDLDTSCFQWGGTPAYFRSDYSHGYNGHMYWTYPNGNTTDNWAEWRPNLPQSGLYNLYVYVPSYNATTHNAKYEIHSSSGISYSVVDQSPYYDQWVYLGSYTFGAGTGGYIRLTDATGEGPTTSLQIGFDAIKWDFQLSAPAAPALSGPANGTTFVDGANEILSWQPVAYADSYTMEWWQSNGQIGALPNLSSTSINAGSLTPETYSWHVKASNAAGTSGWSPTWTFTVKPAAPSYLAGVATSCTQANLSWAINGSNRDGFKIYRNGSLVGQVGSTTSSFRDNGLAGGTTYSYDVTAYKGNLESTASNTVTISTPACPPPLTVNRVWTNDGGSDWTSAKTAFTAGDPIRYVGSAQNNTGGSLTGAFVWTVAGPSGQILNWSGNLTTGPGATLWAIGSTLPTTATSGTYTFSLSVTYNGVTSTQSTSFDVTALPTSTPTSTTTPTLTPTAGLTDTPTLTPKPSASATPSPPQTVVYRDDFSSYTPGLPPTGWAQYGSTQIVPAIAEVGGTGPAYRLLNFPGLPSGQTTKWLVKDGLVVGASTVTTKVNFQSDNDDAGLSIAFQDVNNEIRVTVNPYWQKMTIIETANGQWRQATNSNPGTLPVTIGQDYWLRAQTVDNGAKGGLTVIGSWSMDGINFTPILQISNLANVRGQVGYVTWSYSPPSVDFDDFTVATSILTPTATESPTATVTPTPTLTPTTSALPVRTPRNRSLPYHVFLPGVVNEAGGG